jgi:hypothetical protein
MENRPTALPVAVERQTLVRQARSVALVRVELNEACLLRKRNARATPNEIWENLLSLKMSLDA